MYGPKTHKYEFESNDEWVAYMFLDMLTAFNISPEYLEIRPPHIGSNYISFWCTPKTRERIEYCYRRYIRLPKILINADSYQQNMLKMRRDRYAIV